MRAHLPPRRTEWSADADPDELAVVRRYMAALESGDYAFSCVLTSANQSPAVATYLRAGADGPFEAFGLTVFEVAGGRIAELTVYPPDLYPGFGLPLTR